MDMAKTVELSKHVGQAGKDDHHMKDLMRVAVDVKFARCKPFGNPGRIGYCTNHIESGHPGHPSQAHSSILDLPAVQDQSVGDKAKR